MQKKLTAFFISPCAVTAAQRIFVFFMSSHCLKSAFKNTIMSRLVPRLAYFIVLLCGMQRCFFLVAFFSLFILMNTQVCWIPHTTALLFPFVFQQYRLWHFDHSFKACDGWASLKSSKRKGLQLGFLFFFLLSLFVFNETKELKRLTKTLGWWASDLWPPECKRESTYTNIAKIMKTHPLPLISCDS